MAQNLYGRGSTYDITEDYKYILDKIANKLNVEKATLWIEDHPTISEDCIYSNDKWMGYISEHIDELDNKDNNE